MKKIIMLLVLCLTISCCVQKDEVKLHSRYSGVYEIDVTLDDSVTLPFLLDSGCSETTLPGYVIMTLIKAGKIKKIDFLQSGDYILADGSLITTERVLIRKMKIGNTTIINVPVSISDNEDAPLLLGQNALSKLSQVTIDYRKNIMRIADTTKFK